MEPATTTAESIVRAARQALIETGPRGLTHSAVAAAAGVSRPTLYRYFPTKAHLLDALSAHEEARFDTGLRELVEAHRGPRPQLDAALRYIVNYLDDAGVRDRIGMDPAHVLGSLALSLGPHIESVAALLDDALQEVPAVHDGDLSTQQAAELFLRLAYSHYLVPGADADALLEAMRALAGLSRRTARARS